MPCRARSSRVRSRAIIAESADKGKPLEAGTSAALWEGALQRKKISLYLLFEPCEEKRHFLVEWNSWDGQPLYLLCKHNRITCNLLTVYA